MAFTDAEKLQIESLGSKVMSPFANTLSSLNLSIKANENPPTVYAPLLNFLEGAERELVCAMTGLMNQNQGTPFTRPKRAMDGTPDPTQRKERLGQFRFYYARIKPNVEKFMASASGKPGSHMQMARDRMGPTRGVLDAFDLTLSYFDPYPPYSKHGQTIIGPHGDFDFAQWEQKRAWEYAIETFDQLTKAWAKPVPGPDYYMGFGSLASLFGGLGRGMWRWADIDITATEKAKRAKLQTLPHGDFGVQFWMLLSYGVTLMDFTLESTVATGGVIGAYHNLAVSTRAGHDENLNEAREKTSDSWRHANKAAWEALLDFPGANLIDDPEGAAGELPSQSALPIDLTLSAAHDEDEAHTLVTAVATQGPAIATETLEVPDVPARETQF
jgi:hypothetical protein